MSNNNNTNNINHSHNGAGSNVNINTSSALGHGQQQQQQHLHTSQDPHGQPGVSLMHHTVDELLSSEFPLGISNVQHSDGTLNSNVQGNIMEDLDDLFADDFSGVNTSANTSADTIPNSTIGTLHLPPSQPQHASTIPFTSVHSPQKLSPMLQHQQLQDQQRLLLQQQQPSAQLIGHTGSLALPQSHSAASTPSHPSQSPQASPIISQASPTGQQMQNRMQQSSIALPRSAQQQQPQQPQTPQHLPQVATPRPIYTAPSHPSQQQQQSLQQQPQALSLPTTPRPSQANVQMPPTGFPQTQPRPNPAVPNGSTTTPAVARPPSSATLVPSTAGATTIPIAQAGSPLHHILSSISPATGAQLRNLFALLQTNAVTPNEFLARARQLLDPAQFEILDGIRRRHGARSSITGDGSQQVPNGSSPTMAANQASIGSVSLPTPSAASQNSQIRAGQSAAMESSAPTPGSVSTAGISLPSTSASNMNLPSASQQAVSGSVSTSLPPTSANALLSAPVRKRNTDNASTSSTTSDSKMASKRVKTEHQNIVAGSNGPSAASSPMFPSTSGIATPASAASPGVFGRVSLPGQQKAAATSGTGALGATGGGGSGGGAGTFGGASKSSTGQGTGVERVNYDNITDVMGYVGVDLKEESDNIMRDNDGFSKTSGGDGQDRTRIQNFVNTKLLKTIVDRIADSHKLENVDTDVIAYLAMATQERLRGLAEQMILASKHRGRSLATAPPPMYDEEHAMYKVAVSQDVKKQLLAIERVEREEETKRKEQIAERERRLAAGEDLDENGELLRGGIGGAGGGGGSSVKKGKKQKEGGPGVSARNMTEEARKKVANQTALGFAGGSGRTYSWMMGGTGASGGGGGGTGGFGNSGNDGGAASPLPSVSTPGASGVAANAGSPSASGGVSVGGIGNSGSTKPSLSRGSTTLAGSNAGVSGIGSSNALTSGVASSLVSRGVGAGGGSMILPPSTVGRSSSLLRDTARKVNVKDALFCLERDRGGGGGEGSGQRVLIKSYVKWLK